MSHKFNSYWSSPSDTSAKMSIAIVIVNTSTAHVAQELKWVTRSHEKRARDPRGEARKPACGIPMVGGTLYIPGLTISTVLQLGVFHVFSGLGFSIFFFRCFCFNMKLLHGHLCDIFPLLHAHISRRIFIKSEANQNEKQTNIGTPTDLQNYFQVSHWLGDNKS